MPPPSSDQQADGRLDHSPAPIENGGWIADGAARQEAIGGQLVTELRYRRTLQPW